MTNPTPVSIDVFKPSVRLLVKLGSIAIHAKELLSPECRYFDAAAITELFQDQEIKTWLKGMDKNALLPKERKP